MNDTNENKPEAIIISPEAYLVCHEFHGRWNKVIFFTRERAETYSVKWHGSLIVPLYPPTIFRDKIPNQGDLIETTTDSNLRHTQGQKSLY